MNSYSCDDSAHDAGDGCDCSVGRGRDVSLNLLIVTGRTAALGIDGHICELQLILHSFAELKVPFSTAAYVESGDVQRETRMMSRERQECHKQKQTENCVTVPCCTPCVCAPATRQLSKHIKEIASSLLGALLPEKRSCSTSSA